MLLFKVMFVILESKVYFGFIRMLCTDFYFIGNEVGYGLLNFK